MVKVVTIVAIDFQLKQDRLKFMVLRFHKYILILYFYFKTILL